MDDFFQKPDAPSGSLEAIHILTDSFSIYYIGNSIMKLTPIPANIPINPLGSPLHEHAREDADIRHAKSFAPRSLVHRKSVDGRPKEQRHVLRVIMLDRTVSLPL